MESVKPYHLFTGELAEGHGGLGRITVYLAADFDRVSAENLALQQRLTVQDQRVDELESKLEECITEMFLALEDHEVRSAMTVVGRTRFLELVKAHHAALKPTAEADSHDR